MNKDNYIVAGVVGSFAILVVIFLKFVLVPGTQEKSSTKPALVSDASIAPDDGYAQQPVSKASQPEPSYPQPSQAQMSTGATPVAPSLPPTTTQDAVRDELRKQTDLLAAQSMQQSQRNDAEDTRKKREDFIDKQAVETAKLLDEQFKNFARAAGNFQAASQSRFSEFHDEVKAILRAETLEIENDAEFEKKVITVAHEWAIRKFAGA